MEYHEIIGTSSCRPGGKEAEEEVVQGKGYIHLFLSR